MRETNGGRTEKDKKVPHANSMPVCNLIDFLNNSIDVPCMLLVVGLSVVVANSN